MRKIIRGDQNLKQAKKKRYDVYPEILCYVNNYYNNYVVNYVCVYAFLDLECV